jgi:hypothetical protein
MVGTIIAHGPLPNRTRKIVHSPLLPRASPPGAATFFGLRAAPIRLNSVQQTGIGRVLWREIVRSKG